MKLDTFITHFHTDGDRAKTVKSVINNDYVPYTEKISDCTRIVNSCHYVDVDGKRRYKRNSPAAAMMFALVLVDRYTKIDVEYGTETYDELQKSGALGMIVAAIPEAEYQEYSTVMHMVDDDVVDAEGSIAARMDDLKQAIDSAMNAYFSMIDNVSAVNNDGDLLETTADNN